MALPDLYDLIQHYWPSVYPILPASRCYWRSRLQSYHFNQRTLNVDRESSLGTYLPTYQPTYLPTYLHTYLPTFLPTYLPMSLWQVEIRSIYSIFCLFVQMIKDNRPEIDKPKTTFQHYWAFSKLTECSLQHLTPLMCNIWNRAF